MTTPFEDDDDRRAQFESLGQQFIVGGVTCWGILTETGFRQEGFGFGSGVAIETQDPVLRVCLSDVRDVVPDDLQGEVPVEVVDGSSGPWVCGRPPEPGDDGTILLRLRAANL